MRRVLSWGLVAAALAHATPCFAQKSVAFEGTARHAVALQATLANAQVFGAARALDHLVIQQPRQGHFTAGFQTNWIWGATQVPGRNQDDEYVLQSVDLYANNLAFQACTSEDEKEEVGGCAFYASSLAVTFLPDTAYARTVGSLVSFTGPLIYGHAVAPLSLLGITKGRSGLNTIQSSVIGGVAGKYGEWVHVRGGFIGSLEQRGVYGNVYSPRLKAFLTSSLRDQLQDLALFMGGIDGLDVFQLVDRKAVSPIGATTAYFRKMKIAAPQLQADPDAAVGDILGEFDFATAHFAQTNIARYVDVAAAWATAPEPLLHELSGGVHVDPNLFIAGVHGGVTQLPDLPFYGVRGGLRPYAKAEVGAALGKMKDGKFDRDAIPTGVIKYSLRYNHPETLTYFPFAQDAFNMYFVWAGSF